MYKIYLKARAKINLSLEILNKRSDNYHNIKSVFQKINLYDELYIEKNNTNDFILKSNVPSLNTKENIIYKAYLILKERYNNICGLNVFLTKRIPMQAGLGGGSSDCASFILGINRLFNLNLSKSEIESIGKTLGADVVPCFYNKAVLAEEIGNKITYINTNFKYYILIIKPKVSFNTKHMYDLIDKKNISAEFHLSDKIIKGLENNDIELISKNLYNTFEEIQPSNNFVNNIKSDLIKNGAIGSLMTGSGSCVYGLFKDKQSAQIAYNNLKSNYETYICTSYNSKKVNLNFNID